MKPSWRFCEESIGNNAFDILLCVCVCGLTET